MELYYYGGRRNYEEELSMEEIESKIRYGDWVSRRMQKDAREVVLSGDGEDDDNDEDRYEQEVKEEERPSM